MRTSNLVLIPLVAMTVIALTLRADEPGALQVSPAAKEAIQRITADSLRGHVAFLASDLLEGRGTPSRGLDLAAEYIAAQFRRAGLEPIGDDGYFQTAPWPYLAPDPGTFSCEVKIGDESIGVDERHVSAALTKALDVPPTTVVKVDASDRRAYAALRPEEVAGKVVLAEVPSPAGVPPGRMAAAFAAR